MIGDANTLVTSVLGTATSNTALSGIAQPANGILGNANNAISSLSGGVASGLGQIGTNPLNRWRTRKRVLMPAVTR